MNIPTTVASTVTHTPPAGLKKFSQTLQSIKPSTIAPVIGALLGASTATAASISNLPKMPDLVNGDKFQRPVYAGTGNDWPRAEWPKSDFPFNPNHSTSTKAN